MKKSIIFLIVFLLVFAQCKKTDEILLHPDDSQKLHQYSNEVQFSTLTREEVLKDNSFCEILSSTGNVKGEKLLLKSGNTSTDIKVKWNKVKKIKKGMYESFTFLIDDVHENRFSNLLFELKGNEKKILKLEYFPDSVWYKNRKTGLHSHFAGRVIINELLQPQLNLKSVVCYQVEMTDDNECPNPACDGSSGCIFGPHSPTTYYVTHCYSNPSDTGGSTFSGSEISQTPGSTTTGSYTNIVNPYLSSALYNALIETEALLGVDIEEQPQTPPYLIDHWTYLTQGKLVSSDPSGGFTFYCKGKYVYVRGNDYWVDLTGQGNWHKAKPVTNMLSVEITNLMGRAVWEMAEILGRYVLPVEDFCIILTGTDFDGLESNRYLSGTFLVLQVIPATKILKPVANTMGNATRYLFKYGSSWLNLEKVSGVVKFTDNTLIKLTTKATNNASSTKVLLGKYIEGSTDSYEKIAKSKGWCHFDLGNDCNNLKALTNDYEMWRINKQFLDNCKAQKKTIYFYHDPYNIDYAKGGYLKEISYLTSPEFGGRIEWDNLANMYKVVF